MFQLFMHFARPASLYCEEYVYMCTVWQRRYCIWITVATNEYDTV